MRFSLEIGSKTRDGAIAGGYGKEYLHTDTVTKTASSLEPPYTRAKSSEDNMDYENLTPQYRIEEYLEAIVEGWVDATVVAYPDYPSWRLEEFLDAFITYIWEDGGHPRRPCPDPVWRLEECLRAIYDVMTGAATPWPFPLPPTNRIEEYLAAIHAYLADGTELPVPEPVWRIEQWLAYALDAVKQGGGVVTTVSGSPAHITNALAKAALSVLASIEPIQDLHGYDSPWPAGGGKNKLNFDGIKTIVVRNGSAAWGDNTVTLTATSNDCYLQYGVASWGEDVRIPVSEGDVVRFTWTANNALGNAGIFQNGTSSDFALAQSDAGIASLTVKPGCSFVTIRVGVNLSGDSTTFSNLMVTVNNADTTFAPYSNICPISGRTGLNVYRAGANLSRCGPASDFTHLSSGITYDWKASTQTWDISGDNESIGQDKMISIKLSADSNSAIMAGSTIYYYENLPVGCCADMRFLKDGVNTYSQKIIGTGEYKATAITVPNDYAHGGCWVRFGTLGTALHVSGTDVHMMISTNQPAQWVKFEEIQKSEIDWTSPAGTVYGGTLDVVAGVLTVTHVSMTPTINWLQSINSYGIANFGFGFPTGYEAKNTQAAKESIISNLLTAQTSSIASTQEPGIMIANSTGGYLRLDSSVASTIEQANTWIAENGFMLVYELATPLTYQLTAQEVQMLLGENYVWSSSGDTVSVTYYAEGNANPLQSLNILLGGRYSNPKTADDVSDKEALEIILGGNK